jgi:methionyl-tRNA formyltransferase
MAKTRPSLVFFGTEAWGVPSLQALVVSGYKIAAVVTRPDAPAGRQRSLQPTPVKTAALALDLPVWQPEKPSEIIEQLKQLRPSLGVLIAYGKLIPQSVLDLFPLGVINFHPSALPKYRGPSPIETAILEGAEPGHISFIKLSAGMDDGDIIAQHQIKLADSDQLDAPELYRRLGEAGAPLLAKTVGAILAGTAEFTPQNEAEASLSRIITKADGELDFSRSAAQLERQVRAFRGWPGSHMELLNTKVILTKVHPDMVEETEHKKVNKPGTPLRTESGELAVTTAEGLLVLDRLIPAGKREMTGREFLAGHPLAAE